MHETQIDVRTREHVAILTFVPPAGSVATLSGATILKLEKALNANKSARIFVLTGRDKTFVSGADIKEMSILPPSQAKVLAETGQRVFRMLELLPQPVIAAINGFALGGGCELALACDIRIAVKTAKLGFPEVGLGVAPAWAATQRLPRLIGLSRAKEMILTGRPIKGEEALAIGLVHAVVEPDRLMDSALREAKRLCEKSGNAVAIAKKALASGYGASFDEGSRVEAHGLQEAFEHPDREEGMKAFLEKRKPQFK